LETALKNNLWKQRSPAADATGHFHVSFSLRLRAET
jgi:hypothetical protein